MSQEDIAIVTVVLLYDSNRLATRDRKLEERPYGHGGLLSTSTRTFWRRNYRSLKQLVTCDEPLDRLEVYVSMDTSSSGIQEPFDLIRLSLSERVFVKLRGDRELTGVLHVSLTHIAYYGFG